MLKNWRFARKAFIVQGIDLNVCNFAEGETFCDLQIQSSVFQDFFKIEIQEVHLIGFFDDSIHDLLDFVVRVQENFGKFVLDHKCHKLQFLHVVEFVLFDHVDHFDIFFYFLGGDLV